jgi:hypothetical protein
MNIQISFICIRDKLNLAVFRDRRQLPATLATCSIAVQLISSVGTCPPLRAKAISATCAL